VNSKKGHSIVIPLMGGLGNQLFQFAAALHLRKFKGFKVTFADWTATGSILSTKRHLEIESLIERAHFQLQNTYPKTLARLISKVSTNTVYWESRPSNRLLSTAIANQKIAVGFFQIADVVESVSEELIDLISSSNFFPGLICDTPNKKIAVHVRYGDYLNNKKTRRYHGLSTESYYIDSAIELATELSLNKVLFVTDNIDQLHLDYRGFFSKTNLEVETTQSADPFIDFVQIANCKGIVASNSSYSWWAAWFGHSLHQSRVTIPTPWLSKYSDYDRTIPKETWTVRERGIR